MKKYLFASLIFTIAFIAGCQQKKEPVTIKVTQQDTVKTKVPVPEPIVEEEIPEIDRGVHLTDKYFLIFNAYTVEEFAKEWNKKFQKKGYNSAIVMRNDNGYFCLALESYNDYNMAKEAMIRLREEPDLENVWIMKK